MHLLAATQGVIADGSEAVDLAQSPGDIVLLSSADTEIALLAAAQSRLREQDPLAPRLRLAPIPRLGHNFSVDLYMETVAQARLVIARLLGGSAYWPYGVERLVETCREHRIPLALLPGDDRPDSELAQLSTLPPGGVHRLRRYLAEGGPANAENLLRYAGSLIGYNAEWAEPAALLRAGLYWPDRASPSLDDIAAQWNGSGGVAPIIFYRALVQSGNTAPVDALIGALTTRGLRPLPVFVQSLKDGEAAALLGDLFAAAPPAVILNATGFSVNAAAGKDPLAQPDCSVLQVVFAGNDEESWRGGTRGLGPRDLAMNVALPEIDGRMLSRAVSFKAPLGRDPETEADLIGYRPVADRIAFVADLARNWARLREKPPAERRVALILANYPNRDGRIGNGVGLDTPASAIAILQALAQAGYRAAGSPENPKALVARLLNGPTNANPHASAEETLAFPDYSGFFATLPRAVQQAVIDRWGPPECDPFFRPGRLDCGRFAIPGFCCGNVAFLIQPARGYNIDAKSTYHDPALVPPHSYFAAYAWLAADLRADAVIHLGKHGTLEWLPGKALALSAGCFPEAVFGPMPHLYPFIVNDPGEGTQAKRRAQAVIVDHLTPPLTRAGSYGVLAELERLIDEYYEASQGDRRRVAVLASAIVEQARTTGLDRDCGIAAGEGSEAALRKLDGFLCELKELQIRDGLHVFGTSPQGEQLDALLLAFARAGRGAAPQDASLLRALAADLGLGQDPLALNLAEPWTGPHHAVLTGAGPWRSAGDTVERLEALARRLVAGEDQAEKNWLQTLAVLGWVESQLRPSVAGCGEAELAGLLAGLGGHFVSPGPSGAPSRGRPDVLPTGRNFFSVDTRAVPTQVAWQLGWKSAALLLERHAQENGNYPARVALSAWGTANMRTGGDDVAQALALMGVRPVWEPSSGRVTADRHALEKRGVESEEAERRAGYRVFGSKPGAYGAGLQTLIDERIWQEEAELANAYLDWSGYAYGAGTEGRADRAMLEARLAAADAVLHNQDNREHDLLDSDDYYQFEGGLALVVRQLSGRVPAVWHNDHSRPEMPRIRSLREELGRVVRGRAANPRWIAGIMRHGYKGAAEIAATVDYLFAFAATSRAVDDAHFDTLYDAYLTDDAVRGFMAEHNAAALAETALRFVEAIDRGLWRPRRNSVRGALTQWAGK